jgi:hypothetical protein
MFNKSAFVGRKKFWRYQNARYNDKKINYITICFDQNFGYLQTSISHKKYNLQLKI